TVEAALTALEELGEAGVAGRMRRLLGQGKLRAMNDPTFQRPRERCTFGYTDERGRVLLNPRLCFASLTAFGREGAPCDVVVTLSTLVHEHEHVARHASEEQALEAEWRFLRRAVGQPHRLRAELASWEGEMDARVEERLGREGKQAVLARIR
ncbi:MAG: hypothetical protein AB1758_37410, partial [Candidatus Eremiobacterota bacterium]